MPKTLITFALQRKQAKPQHGFTLLELLVVVSLLGLLSLTAVAIFDNAGDQDRFEATRSRLASIRTAIIGDTSRTLNGEPILSGYVADMGRLPSNIAELLIEDDTTLGVSQAAWAEYGIDDVAVGVSVVGLTGKLYAGWRGPYLFGNPEASGTAFRDGWGTEASPTHVEDFDWNVILTDASGTVVSTGVSAATIAVQSYGSDRSPGGIDYAEDYPLNGNLVEANQWQLGVSNVVFNLNFSLGASSTIPPPAALELELYYVDMEDGSIDDSNTVPFTLGASDTHVQVSMPVTTKLPMGRYAVAVLCPAGVSPTHVFNGKCNDISNGSKEVYYFNMLPNTQHVTVHWNTP
ncbi:MAG: hypothetical protein CTY12_07725 [Methylotenera sp.]|nr:MAG: hypothetical protein CTY12_07725 [Methylotenera sp.]